MERYITATYRLHDLHMSVLGGYVPTRYPKYELKCYMLIYKTLSFLVR